MEVPENPAGAFVPEDNYGQARRNVFITTIANAPKTLRKVVTGLSDSQLDMRYKNWTVRQIVNHVADSHVNGYVRFKLTLTEKCPTIKPYNETLWSTLEESRTGDVQASLMLLEGLHARWVHLLRSMTEEQFAQSFFHPETEHIVTLSGALCLYAWHCRHHAAQICWLRQQNGWSSS